MDKHMGNEREHDHEEDVDREDGVRRALDEHGDDKDKFDPRGGEDPGVLELTEDPLERRMKRHTM